MNECVPVWRLYPAPEAVDGLFMAARVTPFLQAWITKTEVQCIFAQLSFILGGGTEIRTHPDAQSR